MTRALLALLLASPAAALLATKDRELADPFYDGVVYIRRDAERVHCTGALISPRVVLTAAHCVRAPLPVAVFFGQGARNFVGVGILHHDKHPSFVDDPAKQDSPGASGLDVGYIILDAELPGRPVYRVADAHPGASVHAVGYGGNDLGLRAVLDLRVLRPGEHNPHRFYAERGVLGGDSGGPGFDAARRIVAIASTKSADRWGQPIESVYVLLGPALPWLRAELGARGITLE